MLISVAPSASAHATVVSTSPSDGQVVATAPTVVSVRFDEPVQMQFGALRVFSPTGSRVDEGSPSHPTGHSDTVEVALTSGLGHGTYTVAWHVISADSHPVSGAFTFSVGSSSATSVSQDTLNAGGSKTVGVLYGIARGVAYGGFALIVGATGFLLYCWPPGGASRRVRAMIAAGWGALVAATLAVLGLQGPYDGGFGLDRVFDTTVLHTTLGTRLGTALAVRLMLLGLYGVGLALLLPKVEKASVNLRIAATSAGAALAIGIAATWAAADHAGVGSQVPLALPLDIVHVMAMGTWLGGLTVVVAALLRPAGADVPVLARAVRRFSTIAACCIGALVATGTYQAWRQVGTLGALTGTVYGRLLLVKLLGVGLLIALGYLARVWIAHYLSGSAGSGSSNKGGSGSGSRSGSSTARSAAVTPDAIAIRQLRRSTGLEVALATGVLAVTAMLVNAPPARTAFAAPVSTTVAFDTGGPNGKGSVQVFVGPAKTGNDTVHIEVVTPSGEPVSVPQLTASLTLPDRQLGPLPVTLSGAGTSHYYGGATIPLAGAWKLAVTVRTDDIDETTVVVPVTIR
ncbi:copper resistance protein CopC [Catenulispora pinistramenti]|uniref:copper resistance CopC/CopD family protein n=1 Tax=Catenulispora pinistramenti TaxID=2705254 RepID=UPI0027DDEDF9|nr:copper resistance protein CopC [Catenulispora pinistramenti]